MDVVPVHLGVIIIEYTQDIVVINDPHHGINIVYRGARTARMRKVPPVF